MNKGWLELESDPGLFTLLLEDFGVDGVQVEEVYDLQKSIDGPVYGFIFLFRWTEERRCRRKTSTEVESSVKDDEAINKIFFAKQVIPDSCATHALLSVLLNCGKVKLGANLTRFKEFTQNMSPEDKGYAIGNMPELAQAHNTYARPEPRHLPEKQPGISTGRTMEAFHFVSYVPINNHLYELDGLKPYPVDHGPWEKTEDWTEKFRRVISDRLGMPSGGEPASLQEIRFSLMAVVPDRRQVYEHKLQTLKINHRIVLEALQQMMKNNPEGICLDDRPATEGKESEMESATSGDQERNLESSTLATSATQSLVVPPKLASSLEKLETITEDPKEDEEVPKMSAGASSSTEASSSTSAEKGDNLDTEDKKPECFPLPAPEVGADVTKPLTIETKFWGSSGPSSESTDTASEVGSTFSSPGNFSLMSCQTSPHFLEGHTLDSRGVEGEDKMEMGGLEGAGAQDWAEGQLGKSRHRRNHNTFTPKDLLDLLKNLEHEIKVCEENLREEYEKREKYKIDHCRRTHNYDKFILTFLTLLAKQGKLAGLVEQNLVGGKKRGQAASVNRLQPQPATITTAADKRRKARSRRRR